MRLAAHLGMTLRECVERVDSEEMALWIALDRIEPWSAGRLDILVAHLCCTVARVTGGKGKRPEIRDFLLDWWARPKTPESVAEDVRRGFASLMSGRRSSRD